MARKRFSEDVLTKALDYCDERGLRFGQFVHSVLREHGIGPGGGDKEIACSLFYCENEHLEAWMARSIEKSRQRRETLESLVQEELKDGSYDVIPDAFNE